MSRLRSDPTRLEVIGDGSQERDLSFVTDVAEAFLVAATRAPARGESLNVASGASLTIADLLSAIGRVWGASPTVRYTGRTRPGDAERWRVDVSALAALGHSPRVRLDEGLRAVRDWMRNA
jgi:UDP-glucose 4-epimerase